MSTLPGQVEGVPRTNISASVGQLPMQITSATHTNAQQSPGMGCCGSYGYSWMDGRGRGPDSNRGELRIGLSSLKTNTRS